MRPEGDFLVDKAYLSALIHKQFPDTPLQAKHRTGQLWNRMCWTDAKVNPFTLKCLTCVTSWIRITHWSQHNEKVLIWASDIVEHGEDFLNRRVRGMGDAANADFAQLMTTLKQELESRQG